MCLEKEHSEVELPPIGSELTLQTVRQTKSEQVWVTKLQEQHASILTAILLDSVLHFEMAVYEPKPQTVKAEYRLDGCLVDLQLSSTSEVHMLMQYNQLYVY